MAAFLRAVEGSWFRRRARRSAPIVALVAVLAACSSMAGGYGPYSVWKNNGSGYTDTQLAANQWLVSYRGNGMTDPTKALDFSLLRAADLTLASGNKYFTVAEAQDLTERSTVTLPGQSSTTATGTVTCNSAGATTTCSGLGSSKTTGTGPRSVTAISPGTMLRIIAYPEQPASGGALDASVISHSIRAKYGIKDSTK